MIIITVLFLPLVLLFLLLTRIIFPRYQNSSASLQMWLAITCTLILIQDCHALLKVIMLVALFAVCAWFAWSTRVPLFFKQLSWERLVGEKNYRAEDVPNTVWARPKFIASWWPTWL